MPVRNPFSPEDLAAVRAATLEAEAKSGGELVCVVVTSCDTYEAATWKAAAAGAVGGALVAGLWQAFTGAWITTVLPWILLPPVFGAAVGLALTAAAAVRRALIPEETLDRRVDRRAAVAFLDEQIFATRDRTGVLLFVALFERRVRILCDRGIEAQAAEEVWEEITAALCEGLHSDDPGAALVRAVEQCGRVLVDHGVERRVDDEDELSNEPRIHDA